MTKEQLIAQLTQAWNQVNDAKVQIDKGEFFNEAETNFINLELMQARNHIGTVVKILKELTLG